MKFSAQVNTTGKNSTSVASASEVFREWSTCLWCKSSCSFMFHALCQSDLLPVELTLIHWAWNTQWAWGESLLKPPVVSPVDFPEWDIFHYPPSHRSIGSARLRCPQCASESIWLDVTSETVVNELIMVRHSVCLVSINSKLVKQCFFTSLFYFAFFFFGIFSKVGL